MLKQYGILFVFLFSSLTTSAQQKNVETQNLLWTRYLLNFKVSEKWTPFFDIEERMYMFPFRQHHLLPSIGANYKLDKHFSLRASMMYFELTLPQDPKANFKEIQKELRPQASINFNYGINERWSFLSRFKIEWRYIKTPDQSEYAFRNYRFRMRMGLKFKINERWSAKVLEEIHFNVGKNIVRNVFDQNRLSAGLNYKFNSNFSIETGYMYWFQQRFTGDDFFSRNIVYFTLRQNLKFY
ncbi:MAG: DUF2490 domain-containing protein [Bacteroidetes bacterium]|jgi:long-subunit fatty acid transport protein|nr:DUF2490 domain-containing protein [Bacteroidota bacterium]